MERSSHSSGRHSKSSSGLSGVSSPLDKSEDTTSAVREQDRFMPIANVIRIMRRVLPTHAKIADDAKETMQECVSEYISFVTSEANERCQQEQRKTITAEDILWAMSKLGFDDYVQPLSLYLQRYREAEGDSRGGPLRAETMMMPLKRATSDAGVFHHHAYPPHDLPLFYQHYPHAPPPQGLYLGGSSERDGEQVMGRYLKDGSMSHGVNKDGFHPFGPYR